MTEVFMTRKNDTIHPPGVEEKSDVSTICQVIADPAGRI
jgi:hypothetical protein